MSDEIVFLITVEDIQKEAVERIGRKLNNEEIIVVVDNLECGICFPVLDIVYNTIFTEIIQK
jgi:hypothetical protein